MLLLNLTGKPYIKETLYVITQPISIFFPICMAVIFGDISLCHCVTSPSLNSGNYPTVFVAHTQNIWGTANHFCGKTHLPFFWNYFKLMRLLQAQLKYFICIFCLLWLFVTLIEENRLIFLFPNYICLTIINESELVEKEKVQMLMNKHNCSIKFQWFINSPTWTT